MQKAPHISFRFDPIILQKSIIMTLIKNLTLNFCLLSCSLGAIASEDFKPHNRNLAFSRSLSLDFEDLQLDSSKSPVSQSHVTPHHVDPYDIKKIQSTLIKNGVSVGDLEGGFALVFNTAGKLQNPTICHLHKVSQAMCLGSPDAYLVMGIIHQIHGSYDLAFKDFLIAASGNNGNSERACGGTSSELAFYTMHKLLSQGGFKEENGKLIQASQQYKYSAETYKQYTTPESILESQLQGLTEVVKNQSRSHQRLPLSSESGKHSIFSLVSPRGHAQSTNHQNSENEERRISRSPSFLGSLFHKTPKASSSRLQVEALVSPRPQHKKK